MLIAGWMLAALNVIVLFTLVVFLIRVSFQRRALMLQTVRLREQEARVMQVLVDLAKKGHR